MAKATKLPTNQPLTSDLVPKITKTKGKERIGKKQVNNPTEYLKAFVFLQRAHYYDYQGKPAKSLKDYFEASRLLALFLKKHAKFPIRKLLEQELKLCLHRIAQLKHLDQKKMVSSSTTNLLVETPSKDDQQTEDLRELLLKCRIPPNPKYSWNNIIGLDLVKEIFEQVIIFPLNNPHVLETSFSYPRNILLFGPPGCGKTLLIKALANLVDIPLFSISASTLLSKWHGESQKMVRALYETAWEFSPSIIFIDEFDGVFGSPSNDPSSTSNSPASHITVQLQKELQQFMDGMFTPSINHTVTIVATNNPKQIQPAQLRRFDRVLYIAPPSEKIITHLLTHYLRDISHSFDSEKLEFLAYALHYHTPDEIQKICASAYFLSLTTSTNVFFPSIRDVKTVFPPREVNRDDFNNIMKDTPAILKVLHPRGSSLSKFTSFNRESGNPQINYPKHPCEKLVRNDFINDSWMARSKRNITH